MHIFVCMCIHQRILSWTSGGGVLRSGLVYQGGGGPCWYAQGHLQMSVPEGRMGECCEVQRTSSWTSQQTAYEVGKVPGNWAGVLGGRGAVTVPKGFANVCVFVNLESAECVPAPVNLYIFQPERQRIRLSASVLCESCVLVNPEVL